MAREVRGNKIFLPNTYPSWKGLQEDLESLQKKEVQGVPALETILKKNDRWENIHTPFKLLGDVLKKDDHFTEGYFSDILLPWLAKKALQVQELFADQDFQIQNLHKAASCEVELSRQQVCCLLALAFFNAFDAQGMCYQQLTLACWYVFNMYRSQVAKVQCLLHYFERIYEAEEKQEEKFLSMRITFLRRSLQKRLDAASWRDCEKKLLPFESLSKGTIEGADGCLQVDFANAFIGGGVLNLGNVQEEIRFVINPECLISILFCEEMEDRETILIVGAEQFSSYSGYGGKFKWSGPHQDKNPVDDRGRCSVSIVAMDATCFSSKPEQFQERCILRELNKAYCGFGHTVPGDDSSASRFVPVATGNWGCGMFGGIKMLKTVIQWMAASRAGRETKYFTFDDDELQEEQKRFVEALIQKNVTVGQLFQLIPSLAEIEQAKSSKNVFDYLLSRLEN